MVWVIGMCSVILGLYFKLVYCFIIIDLALKQCFFVNTAHIVERVRLRNAICHLRNCPNGAIGFSFSPIDNEPQQLCTIHEAHGPYASFNRIKVLGSMSLSGRMTRIIINKYPRVGFLARQ